MTQKPETLHVLGGEGELRVVTPTRLALVGCGGHAYRNVLPPLRQIPEAVMTGFCDTHIEKAQLYAQTQGTNARSYADVGTLLDAEPNLDALLVVVGFDDDTGEPLYPTVVEQILRRGLPVWLEKPPAADRAGVRRMADAARDGGTFAQVGFKKVFSPAVGRLKQLTRQAEFGRVTRYTYSYDVDLPAEVGNLRSPSGRRFLDDFVHVASVIEHLIGVPALVQTVRGPTGAGLIVNQHADGAIGTVALSSEASGLSPVERIDVVGQGANAVLENGAYLRYYPPGNRGPYGTSTNYFPAEGPADLGPRFWEPEFSLGNLHGGSHFVQGYFHQLRHFVDSVRAGNPPDRCGLDVAERVMAYLDALVGPFGEWRPIAGQPAVDYRHVVDQPQRLVCPRTGRVLVLKDGWNYICRDCGRTRSGQTSADTGCDLA
ncbi:Gfo/Idh/MocA family oxidoreductase [Mesorhizobium sp. M6A.T.Ce.TU.016.01.1.1]|uniref:Gfo/Idh/MocA family protein n=1 Tax=Mesorhizobium sp. M6A.T.Ce.TU.016.01.1.1 TaxID=2496783 RepID=UPI000FCC3CC1|nr:Gfo/Idh/MocA family oxidoreductase [Mesorhizobium sp. M6A.T.Ce.TU.016.01.1.1]RUU32408.1 Gfo/Idh/MocA family oxidoreductase [Mesorhizobium sp. M6A.T.Ce.TU.016.01.1.1]